MTEWKCDECDMDNDIEVEFCSCCEELRPQYATDNYIKYEVLNRNKHKKRFHQVIPQQVNLKEIVNTWGCDYIGNEWMKK